MWVFRYSVNIGEVCLGYERESRFRGNERLIASFLRQSLVSRELPFAGIWSASSLHYFRIEREVDKSKNAKLLLLILSITITSECCKQMPFCFLLKVPLPKNGPTPASFSFIFGLFKQTIQFLQQINVKKCHVHPVYNTWIRTHDLSNMSCLPLTTRSGRNCITILKINFFLYKILHRKRSSWN